jgi:hypothetical protein
MRAVLFLLCGACAALAACGQPRSDSATQATANAAQPKKSSFCFFKDEEMKGWAASRGKDGNVTIKGKAHVKDSRYSAVLGPPTVSGTTAELSPTLSQNSSYAAPEDWWDLSATIPNSGAITTVNVSCGSKTVAQLSVPPKS